MCYKLNVGDKTLRIDSSGPCWIKVLVICEIYA